MNLIEKLHALLVSNCINVWHFPAKTESPRFYYWIRLDPETVESHGFDSLEEMIEAAYERIDPLKRAPTSQAIQPPPPILRIIG